MEISKSKLFGNKEIVCLRSKFQTKSHLATRLKWVYVEVISRCRWYCWSIIEIIGEKKALQIVGFLSGWHTKHEDYGDLLWKQGRMDYHWASLLFQLDRCCPNSNSQPVLKWGLYRIYLLDYRNLNYMRIYANTRNNFRIEIKTKTVSS